MAPLNASRLWRQGLDTQILYLFCDPASEVCSSVLSYHCRHNALRKSRVRVAELWLQLRKPFTATLFMDCRISSPSAVVILGGAGGHRAWECTSSISGCVELVLLPVSHW